jgi:hypothetical protein
MVSHGISKSQQIAMWDATRQRVKWSRHNKCGRGHLPGIRARAVGNGEEEGALSSDGVENDDSGTGRALL